MQVGEGDKLFGSVTVRDIAEALMSRGIEIDRRRIDLPEPIKTLGDHEITASFGQGVNAKLKVRVIAA
jgi:large subunit ribosomal protein L9